MAILEFGPISAETISGALSAVQRAMATAYRFQDLEAWKLAFSLSQLIFNLTAAGKCRTDQEFCEQVRRAASKAPPLIAEGFIRFSAEEMVKYLRMARGELGEVQSRLLHAKSQGYFSEQQHNEATTLADRAMAATTALLKSKLPALKKKEKRARRT
jgi:four helix bundle protein